MISVHPLVCKKKYKIYDPLCAGCKSAIELAQCMRLRWVTPARRRSCHCAQESKWISEWKRDTLPQPASSKSTSCKMGHLMTHVEQPRGEGTHASATPPDKGALLPGDAALGGADSAVLHSQTRRALCGRSLMWLMRCAFLLYASGIKLTLLWAHLIRFYSFYYYFLKNSKQ